MGKKVKIVATKENEFYGIRFNCPACKHATVLCVNWLPKGYVESPTAQGKPHWGFNGDFEKPTFTPSVLTRYGHYATASQQPGECACDFQERYPDEEPWPWPCAICHSYLTDGKIQFLSDCTHVLANQTVDLPDIE